MCFLGFGLMSRTDFVDSVAFDQTQSHSVAKWYGVLTSTCSNSTPSLPMHHWFLVWKILPQRRTAIYSLSSDRLNHIDELNSPWRRHESVQVRPPQGCIVKIEVEPILKFYSFLAVLCSRYSHSPRSSSRSLWRILAEHERVLLPLLLLHQLPSPVTKELLIAGWVTREQMI